MYTHLLFKPIGLLAVIVLIVFTAATAVATPPAQEPPGDSPGIDTTVPVPPLEPPLENPPAEGEGADSNREPAAISALPAAALNYQGVLKDADGNGLNGTYAMTFRLFDAASGGGKEWGDEVHPAVAVRFGLFQVELGTILPFDVNVDFDEQLYLEVEVSSVKLPRLPLRPAPYALGLVGGATVNANTASTTAYALDINNTGGRGLYVNAEGDANYGVYNADITYSGNGYAGPDTYLWVPAMNAVIKYGDRTDAHVESQTYGDVAIRNDVTPSSVDVSLPVQYERPYGRDFRVVGYTVYYKTTNAAAYIDQTWLMGRNFSTGANVLLINDGGTNRTSTSYASFTVTAATPVAIATTSLPTNLQLRIQYNVAGTVSIYGVRVQLRSTP